SAGLTAEHRLWESLHAAKVESEAGHRNDPDPERRLRVGYVSAVFRPPPVAQFLEPILTHHKRSRVEVFCYAEVPAPDAVTARLQALVPNWRFICGKSDAQVAGQV